MRERGRDQNTNCCKQAIHSITRGKESLCRRAGSLNLLFGFWTNPGEVEIGRVGSISIRHERMS